MAGSARTLGGSVRLQILGPLRMWRDGVELTIGPRQQALLLALLLARPGRPVSTNELIDVIWGEDAPASALNIIHKYVGGLRRLSEPSLSTRAAGAYLQRRGNAYQFVADPGMVDLITFRELVGAARAAFAEHGPEAALDRYVEALELWHGPAGDGLDTGSAGAAIFDALNAEFFDACTTAAELAISLGRPEQVLRPMLLAASMAPLHESVQASLVNTLAATGQQAEALSVFQRVRTRLAEELGIDPGPGLQAAHQEVLRGTPTSTVGATGSTDRQAPATGGLIGRADELTVLRQAVDSALDGGSRLVLVEGEPGVGKTVLLEGIAAEAAGRGALVVWGRCLEGDGMPSMWPWMQAIGTVLDNLLAVVREERLVGELGRLFEPRSEDPIATARPDARSQFRLFEQVVGVVGQVSTQRPVVLVIDDLQWADLASLKLFGHMATRLRSGIVLIGAFRDRAPTPDSELSRLLALASRVADHRRIRLGPFGLTEVAELVHRETGQNLAPGAARSIHARTAGNPFFVRELSRLLVSGGASTPDAVARAAVPSTVRDVVRGRMAGLDDSTRELLQLAALIGGDIDLSLLTRAADLDIATCLGRLEPVEALGLLGPAPGDPFVFRFAHDLVRESVAAATPPPRVIQLHLSVADALERSDSDGETVAERLAYHLWAAGPLADPARTANAHIRAGHRALTKSALEAAHRQFQSAAQVAHRAGLAELELSALSQLTAVSGMRTGLVGASPEVLERAEHLARGLGQELKAAEFLFARRTLYSQGSRLDRSGPLSRQLLEMGEASDDPAVRALGQQAWGIHQMAVGNIEEAYSYLSRSTGTTIEDLGSRAEDPLRYDLRMTSLGRLAETAALHGDVGEARALLDVLATAASGDVFLLTACAAFAATVETLAGDPAGALSAAERGLAEDPERSFPFHHPYYLLAWLWARAVTGHDPAGAAAEAEAVITTSLLHPPRTGAAAWYALVGEMWLAAGDPVRADAALDRADQLLDALGQRYAEGFLLLMRVRLLQARGEPATAVRAAAEQARTLSIERGAYLFARRTEESWPTGTARNESTEDTRTTMP